jgi:hypothetical protein
MDEAWMHETGERQACGACGAHTFRHECGNCGSYELVPVDSGKTPHLFQRPRERPVRRGSWFKWSWR